MKTKVQKSMNIPPFMLIDFLHLSISHGIKH